MSEVLHFRGDQRNCDREVMLGPDVGGRRMMITDVDYDEDTDVSTVLLRPVMPPEFRERIQPMVAEAHARQKLLGLFG